MNQEQIISQYQKTASQQVSINHASVDPTDDLFPAMVWHFMRLPHADELIRRKKYFEFDELSFVHYVKQRDFWHADVQFLTRKVKRDRLSKYRRDKVYDIFRSHNLKPADISRGSSYSIFNRLVNEIIDGHVGLNKWNMNHRGHKGDWKLLRSLLKVVIRPDDKSSWKAVDMYWKDFTRVAGKGFS